MTPAKETFRSRVQELMRASILDATYERAARMPWSGVKVADVAADVGVSRQTIYNEFGGKEALASALFERELGVFYADFAEAVERSTDLASGLRAAITWSLEWTSQHPILQRMVESARSGESAGMLILLTVRSDIFMLPLRERSADLFEARWPGSDRRQTELLVEMAMRWVISWVIMPSDLSRDEMIEALVTTLVRALLPEQADKALTSV